MREGFVATLDTDEAVVVRDLKSGRKRRNRRHCRVDLFESLAAV